MVEPRKMECRRLTLSEPYPVVAPVIDFQDDYVETEDPPPFAADAPDEYEVTVCWYPDEDAPDISVCIYPHFFDSYVPPSWHTHEQSAHLWKRTPRNPTFPLSDEAVVNVAKDALDEFIQEWKMADGISIEEKNCLEEYVPQSLPTPTIYERITED